LLVLQITESQLSLLSKLLAKRKFLFWLTLDLSHIPFLSDQAFPPFCESFAFSQLTRLELVLDSLSDQMLISLGNGLSGCPNLRMLALCVANNISASSSSSSSQLLTSAPSQQQQQNHNSSSSSSSSSSNSIDHSSSSALTPLEYVWKLAFNDHCPLSLTALGTFVLSLGLIETLHLEVNRIKPFSQYDVDYFATCLAHLPELSALHFDSCSRCERATSINVLQHESIVSAVCQRLIGPESRNKLGEIHFHEHNLSFTTLFQIAQLVSQSRVMLSLGLCSLSAITKNVENALIEAVKLNRNTIMCSTKPDSNTELAVALARNQVCLLSSLLFSLSVSFLFFIFVGCGSFRSVVVKIGCDLPC
jgi:hypothetical protein